MYHFRIGLEDRSCARKLIVYDICDDRILVSGSPNPARIHYFAYGSNMHVPRMLSRVPSAVSCEPASLIQYDLRFHKHGRDGSAKCNIVPSADGQVFGVVYEILSTEAARLDGVEGPDYRRTRLEVNGLNTSRTFEAFAYIARPSAIDDSLLPESWYHEFVVAGATMHELPDGYIRMLEEIQTLPDGLAVPGDDAVD